MSDKLEKCVCGVRNVNNVGIEPHRYGFSAFCCNLGCACSTSNYDTEAEAAEAWNAMMQSLKSGWTSKWPSEDGFYLFKNTNNGIIDQFEVTKGVVMRGMARWQKCDWDAERKGLWYRINYPDPPKD